MRSLRTVFARTARRMAGAPCLGASFALIVALIVALAGCNSLDATLPAGINDPATYKTPAGALAMYNDARVLFLKESINLMFTTGLMSDELQDAQYGSPNTQGGGPNILLSPSVRSDARVLPETQSQNQFQAQSDQDYSALQKIRSQSMQAIGALAKYAPNLPASLRGELYAIQGYAELELAEVFCSGVPLSTFDFEQDFTYKAGSTSDEVYQHAIALFDTAMTLAVDSERVVDFARVGKGRALLELGRYADAAAAVTAVPDTFAYQYGNDWSNNGVSPTFLNVLMVDKKGSNGLPYVSDSTDPRVTHFKARNNNGFGFVVYYPNKYYQPSPIQPMVIAGGTEASLIRAESELAQGGSAWLDTLNALRGPVGLPDLVDPGIDSARVSMLFKERAYWLFLTGHREGDLRRLVRQYHRLPVLVFPAGVYNGTARAYGSDVNAPIPAGERRNPLYTGCKNRDA